MTKGSSAAGNTSWTSTVDDDLQNAGADKTATVGLWSFVKIVLRLKFKMLLRGRKVLNVVLSVIGGGLLALAVTGIVASMVAYHGDRRAPVAIMVAAVVLLVTGTFATMLFGGEHFLNPRPFTLLPIPVGRLLIGLMFAAVLGMFGLAGGIVSYSVLIYADSVVTGLLLFAGATVFWVTLIVSGRTAVATSMFLQRRRRGRDAITAITAVAALVVAGVMQLVVNIAEWVSIDRLETFRNWARWLPWGWAPESIGQAMEGNWLAALAWLFPAVLVPLALFGVWRRLMIQVLLTAAEEVAVKDVSPLLPAYLQGRGNTAMTAAFCRTGLQMKRDPREVIQLAGFLPLLFVSGLPFYDALAGGDDRLVMTTLFWGATIGLLSANLFGADDSSTAVDLITAEDYRPILIGKALFRLALVTPVIVLFGFLVAAATGGWQFLPAAIVLAGSLAVCSTGLGMIVSVRFPYPLPDGLGFNRNNMANTLLPGLVVLAMALAAPVLLAPVLVPSVILSFLWSPAGGLAVALVGIPYSYFVFVTCAGIGARWLHSNCPEFFADLKRAAN